MKNVIRRLLSYWQTQYAHYKYLKQVDRHLRSRTSEAPWEYVNEYSKK